MYPIRSGSCWLCPVVKFHPSSENPCSEFLSSTKHRFDAWCPSFWTTFCHALHFVVTHARTTFCRTYCVPLPDKPHKVRKTCFFCRDFKKERRTDLVQNRPVEFEVVRLDRFCCPSSEHPSRKPLERSILGVRLKSQGCIYLCSANAMTWAPESEPKI